MAEYNSIHSGSNIDTAVSSVLNHTCGIQGVKVFGTELSKDLNNKVDISWSSLTQQGSWTPYLGAENSDNIMNPTVNYEYRHGYYLKLGKLCYISFKIKLKILSLADTSVPNYAFVGGLPFNGATSNGQEWAITVNEFSQGNNSGGGDPYLPSVDNNTTISFWINSGSNRIKLEHSNGIAAIQLAVSSDPNQNLWISGSGIYPID